MLTMSGVDYEILRDKIVKNFNLEIKNGEIITFFGPSGCGKTTILRLISGLEDPNKGSIKSSFKRITYLFQENRLLDNLDVVENIALCMPKVDMDEIKYHLEMVGFSLRDMSKFPYELSGGMSKRVAFMRAFLSKPDLLLLDEPFVGLDMDLKDILSNLIIKRVKEKELSCILVTHDRFEAVLLSDEIHFLSAKGM